MQNTTLYENPIDERYLHPLLSLIKKHDLDPIAYINGLANNKDMLVPSHSDLNCHENNLVRSDKRIGFYKTINEVNTALALVIYASKKDLKEIYGELQEDFSCLTLIYYGF